MINVKIPAISINIPSQPATKVYKSRSRLSPVIKSALYPAYRSRIPQKEKRKKEKKEINRKMAVAHLRSVHSFPLKIPKAFPLGIGKRQLLSPAKCSSSNSEEREPGARGVDSLAGLAGERVEELLRREENRSLLQGLDEASRRVEKAREELESVRKQRDEAQKAREYMRQLESRQAEVVLVLSN